MPQPELVRPPKQQRARVTFERILDATVALLMEEGLTSLNTNRIADRADVNIATVYSYFPNKEAILSYLANRFEDRRARAVELHAKELATVSDWEQWFRDMIQLMVRFRLDEPGGLAVRQAITALPEFHVFDVISTRRATEAEVNGLRALQPSLTRTQARRIARTTTLTITALLDEAFQQVPYDRRLVEDLQDLVITYLRVYLPTPGERGVDGLEGDAALI